MFPGSWGSLLDPSTRLKDRDPMLYGTGKWCRVLIDATVNLDFEPEEALWRRALPADGHPPRRGHGPRQQPLGGIRLRAGGVRFGPWASLDTALARLLGMR